MSHSSRGSFDQRNMGGRLRQSPGSRAGGADAAIGVNKRQKQLLSLRVFYFVYLLGFSVYSPYLNLYFRRGGLSGEQIGILGALTPLSILIFAPIVGILADRALAKNRILGLLLLGSVVCFLGLTILPTFWYIFVIMLIFAIALAPCRSLVDSIVLDFLGGKGAAYGGVRVWGSVGFAAGVVLLGRVIDKFGLGVMFPLYALFGGGSAILAWILLPGSMAPGKKESDEAKVGSKGSETVRMPSARAISTRTPLINMLSFPPEIRSNKSLIAFLFIAFLARMSSAPYYTFLSIHLDGLGASESLIGLAWGLAVTSEIILFFASGRLISWIGAEGVFLAGMIGTAIRWFLFASVSSLTGALALQLLHSMTYGAFTVGAVAIITGRVPAHLRASGQGLLAAATEGLAGIFGSIFAGRLFDAMGLRATFLGSGIIAAISTMLFVALLMYERAGRAREAHAINQIAR